MQLHHHLESNSNGNHWAYKMDMVAQFSVTESVHWINKNSGGLGKKADSYKHQDSLLLPTCIVLTDTYWRHRPTGDARVYVPKVDLHQLCSILLSRFQMKKKWQKPSDQQSLEPSVIRYIKPNKRLNRGKKSKYRPSKIFGILYRQVLADPVAGITRFYYKRN